MEKAITKIEIFVDDRTINLIFNLLRLIKKVLYSLFQKKKNKLIIYSEIISSDKITLSELSS